MPAAILVLALASLVPFGTDLAGWIGPRPLPGVDPEPQARAAPDGWTVPSGTRLVVTLRDTLSTRRSREGEALAATVARSVQVPEGTAVPRGAALYFTPVRLEPSGTAWEPTVVRIRFDSLEVRGGAVRPVQATLLRASSTKSSRTGTLLSVLLMAVAAAGGALLGRWLTGGRGALTGAALAAIAAAVYLMVFQQVDAVLPAGSEMEVRLDRAVEVPAPAGPER